MDENNLNARLPDGTMFDFWEKDCVYAHTYYVDGANPAASDSNDGSEDAPFKTIGAAAKIACPARAYAFMRASTASA